MGKNLPIPVKKGDLAPRLLRIVTNYPALHPYDRTLQRLEIGVSQVRKQRLAEQARGDANLCYIVGGGGGTAMTTGLGAVLATTTTVTTLMVAATGLGLAVLIVGLGAGYALGRKANRLQADQKLLGLVRNEMDKIDKEA
jgi:hypothetical protein